MKEYKLSKLRNLLLMGASGAGKVGGETRAEEELILSSTSKYLFVWAATAASVVNVRFYFYVE